MSAPNLRLLHVRDVLDGLAHRTTAALEHIHRELQALDGYPGVTMGDGTSRGTSELTMTERVADARYQLTSTREQIRDDLNAIEQVVNSYARVLDMALRTRGPRAEYVRCDGRNYEGAELVWVPHSRDPLNGWRDPLCEDQADESGLCPRCLKREERWRRENGMERRNWRQSIEQGAA